MPDQTRNLNSVTDFTGTLDSNDRIIMTDNKASLKALTTDILGKAMIEGYTGSSLAGSSQSVKSAIDGLNSNWVNIDTVSELNSKLSALPSNRTVNVLLQGVVAAALTDNMASSSGKGYITKISVTSVDYTIMCGAGDFIFIGRYNFSDGAVTSVQKVPTRAEMDALNSKHKYFNSTETDRNVAIHSIVSSIIGQYSNGAAILCTLNFSGSLYCGFMWKGSATIMFGRFYRPNAAGGFFFRDATTDSSATSTDFS